MGVTAMASVAFSASGIFPISRAEARPAVRPARKWTTIGSLRTMAEVASGLLFFGLLGWEVYRIGSQLIQLVILMVAGITGSPQQFQAAEPIWPASGPWPW